MSKLIKSAAKADRRQTRMDALVRTFHNNSDGDLILEQIEEWAHDLWINHESRAYAWNPEKAIYKVSLIDLIRRIRDDVRSHVEQQTMQKQRIQRETIS